MRQKGAKKALAMKKLAMRGAGAEMLAMVCSGACPRIEAFSALGSKTAARAFAACGSRREGQGRELCLAYIFLWEALGGGRRAPRLAAGQEEWDKQRAGRLRESGAFAFSAQCAAFGHGPWSMMEDAERARALDALEALDEKALARPAAPYWERLAFGKAPAGEAMACESLRAGPEASGRLARAAAERLGAQRAWQLAGKALLEGRATTALDFADCLLRRFGEQGQPGFAALAAAQLWPSFAARAQRAQESEWRAWLDLGELFDKRLGAGSDADKIWNSAFALALAHSGSAYGAKGWDPAHALALRMGKLGRALPGAGQMGAKGEPLARRASEEGAWARLVSANEEGLLGSMPAPRGLGRRAGI